MCVHWEILCICQFKHEWSGFTSMLHEFKKIRIKSDFETLNVHRRTADTVDNDDR